MSNEDWVIFTPGGTYIYETEAATEDEAWQKLLKEASHMPYDGVEGFKERGYEAVFLGEEEPPPETLLNDSKSRMKRGSDVQSE